MNFKQSLSGYYYFFYDWAVTVGCASPRSKVTATVNPAPSLSITANQTICNNGVGTMTVGTGLSDFNTFTWSPVDNLFTDITCYNSYTALTNASTIYVKSGTGSVTTYTCTATNTSNGCSNAAQSTVTVMPSSPSVAALPASICISGNSTLALSPATGWGAATFQWQTSTNGYDFYDIPGATTTSYTTPIISSVTYYQLVIKNSAGSVCAAPGVTLAVENQTVVNPVNGSRCGSGTVSLEASLGGGGILKWYAAASGGSSIGTGSPFTTPDISTTTTFYVAAEGSNSLSETGGRASVVTTTGFLTTPNWGVVFTAASNFVLNSTTVYPVGTGTVTVALLNSSGVELATTSAINVTGTGATSPNVIPLGFSVPAGTGYKLVLKAYTGITDLLRDPTNTFPYASPSGAISVTSGWTGTATSSSYYMYGHPDHYPEPRRV